MKKILLGLSVLSALAMGAAENPKVPTGPTNTAGSLEVETKIGINTGGIIIVPTTANGTNLVLDHGTDTATVFGTDGSSVAGDVLVGRTFAALDSFNGPVTAANLNPLAKGTTINVGLTADPSRVNTLRGTELGTGEIGTPIPHTLTAGIVNLVSDTVGTTDSYVSIANAETTKDAANTYTIANPSGEVSKIRVTSDIAAGAVTSSTIGGSYVNLSTLDVTVVIP